MTKEKLVIQTKLFRIRRKVWSVIESLEWAQLSCSSLLLYTVPAPLSLLHQIARMHEFRYHTTTKHVKTLKTTQDWPIFGRV